MKIIKEIIPYVIIVITVILIRTFLFTPAIVNGDSMDDTLSDGDVVIVNKIGLSIDGINRYDIVVVDFSEELLIKRVIGLPNENIEYKNNELYINGIKQETDLSFEDTEDFTYDTEDNQYFVLGDNRDISKDSRYFGVIEKEQIKGKVKLVLFPFKDLGIIK